MHYYRLQQVNTNGSATYSKTVKIAAASFLKISSYVLNKKINLQVNAKAGEDYIVDVYSMSGAKLLSSRYKANAGNSCKNNRTPVTHIKCFLNITCVNAPSVTHFNEQCA